MEADLKTGELKNGDSLYYRVSIAHLPKGKQEEVLKKASAGHIFTVFEVNRLEQKGWETSQKTPWNGDDAA